MAWSLPVVSHLLTSALKNSPAPCFSGVEFRLSSGLSPLTTTLNKVFLACLTWTHFYFGAENLVWDLAPTVKQVTSFAQWPHACEQGLS